MKCAQRLYQTANKSKLVPAGHKDAAFLYASEGDEIPDSAAERYGLKDGKLPGKAGQTPPDKARKPAPNKERKPGQKKGQGGANPGKEGATAAALTDIAGIGDATAKKLEAAGIKDVTALGAVDPASPPSIEGLPPAFDWAAITAAAKAAAPTSGD